MMIFSKSARILLAALALGGAALAATGEASARPGGRGGHGGHGWHGGGHGGHGWHGGHRWRGHHWRGYGYGLAGVAYVAGGPRCRLVERVNAYGDVVVRRVCRNPVYY